MRLKITKSKKHTFNLNYELSVIFPNFHENLHNFIAPVFDQPLGQSLGTICRLAVVRLSVTHVL